MPVAPHTSGAHCTPRAITHTLWAVPDPTVPAWGKKAGRGPQGLWRDHLPFITLPLCTSCTHTHLPTRNCSSETTDNGQTCHTRRHTHIPHTHPHLPHTSHATPHTPLCPSCTHLTWNRSQCGKMGTFVPTQHLCLLHTGLVAAAGGEKRRLAAAACGGGRAAAPCLTFYPLPHLPHLPPSSTCTAHCPPPPHLPGKARLTNG